ncbi:MAG TPA: glycoside hydrolase family 18 protein, partial [Fimbriimonas sp.]|nr:glycoside hydrolase family 18 protein [Fimbriimonas sp.]
MLKISIGTLALALASLSLAWDRKIIAYYPEYSPSAFNYPVSQVPGNRLDVLNYFYIGDGGSGHTDPLDLNGNLHVSITNSASQLVALKQSYPHLKVMLSIREDADWVTIASDSSKLANFVSQLQTLFAASTAYDGLDIDWEVQDLFGNKAHLASLLQAVRTMMNSQSVILGRPLYLSVAVIAGAPLYNPESYDFNSLDTNCDWLNVMTYDFHTKGADLNQVPHPPTWHAAALNSTTGETVWNVSNQMNRWLVRMRVNNSSYPKKKLMMGVP